MPHRLFRAFCAVALAASLAAYTAEITAGRKSALDHVSAKSLEGHVSFLASDLLEGRNTPSAGLDIAAEYIASQFRRAGLKPAGDNGYFQTGHLLSVEHSAEGAELGFETGDKRIQLGKKDLRVIWAERQEFAGAAPVKVNPGAAMTEAIDGKVVVIALEPNHGPGSSIQALEKWKPAAAIFVQTAALNGPEVQTRLEEPGKQPAFTMVRVANEELYKLVQTAAPGSMDARLSLRIRPRSERIVDLKNVAAILPGSDPALAGTYILVTAHYDHLGKKSDGDDRIYNGANDDASGVASVIEIAQALSAAGAAPRRSILFMTYYGEEEGLLGSRYYAGHPLVPLAKTAANINLEHLGRTDGDLPAGSLTMTGFGYSDLTTALELAGTVTGIKVHDPGRNGDAYFNRSDNQSLANAGIPAHTFAAAFDFPDYHKVSDEWQKIDFANMEKVDRTLALTILMAADSVEPPQWNESNKKTERYVSAQHAFK